MVATFGGMIGGVGLLFFGMWLLSENIKTVAGPRIPYTGEPVDQ